MSLHWHGSDPISSIIATGSVVHNCHMKYIYLMKESLKRKQGELTTMFVV